MKLHIFLNLSILVFITACSNETFEPQESNEQKQLQSVELNYPSGQIVFDSLFYEDAKLVGHVNQSTGWIDILTYSFDYSTSSTTVFLDQNGNQSGDFVKKDNFNSEQQLIQTVIKKEDGSVFATYDLIYNIDGILVGQHVTSGDQIYTDSISVDVHGNRVEVKRIDDGTRVVITYDDNPNPFYQLPLIINTFQTHSPNNLTRFQIFHDDILFFEKTYQYEYGSDNYPTRVVVQGSLPQDPEETHHFYYQ